MADEDRLPTEPYAAVGTSTEAVQEALEVVMDNIGDAWVHDADFFEKFFPVDHNVRSTYQKSRIRLHRGARWSGISLNPPKLSRLYTPLNNLINNVLVAFQLMDGDERTHRLSLNTSSAPVKPQVNYPLSPPLLLTGSGKYFVCSEEKRPVKHYASGISPIEVRHEDQDATVARNRLSAYILQLMSHQLNRRYVFGLVMSPQTLTVYMFDHSGVVASPSLDYHAHPEQFCAIIYGLASKDAGRLGLDTTMFLDGPVGKIRTREGAGTRRTKIVEYTVISVVYSASDIVGRATVCFAAFETTFPGTRYVIKDSWVAANELTGKESEASLLAHARSRGVTKGIPVVRHTEHVNLKGHNGRLRLDSTLNNRQDRAGNLLKVDRIHTRLIMAPFGKPLDRFSNRKELLLAYHDALQAHRHLYDVAGILHRDIKPGNILINPRGDDGNRGILIDFDHAIRIEDTSPYSMKNKIGTYIFISRHALEGSKHTAVDDLESFYYTLVYICLMFTGPGLQKKEVPYPLKNWYDSLSASSKLGFFMKKFFCKVEPWFGKPYQTLLERLHLVFHGIVREEFNAITLKQPQPTANSADIYDMVLSSVRKAMDDLDQENVVEQDGARSTGTSHNVTNGGRNEESGRSGVFSWMRDEAESRRHTKNFTTLAGNRARRTKAK